MIQLSFTSLWFLPLFLRGFWLFVQRIRARNISSDRRCELALFTLRRCFGRSRSRLFEWVDTVNHALGHHRFFFSFCRFDGIISKEKCFDRLCVFAFVCLCLCVLRVHRSIMSCHLGSCIVAGMDAEDAAARKARQEKEEKEREVEIEGLRAELQGKHAALESKERSEQNMNSKVREIPTRLLIYDWVVIK